MAPPTRQQVKRARLNSQDAEELDLAEMSEEGKAIIAHLTKMFNDAVDRIIAARESDDRYDELKLKYDSLKKESTELRERLDDLEANQRMNTLIITGDVPAASPNEDVISTLQNVIKNKINYELPRDSISTAYRVGKKSTTQAPDKRSIVFRLNGKDLKDDIRKACRTVKPRNLYVNESLIPSRSTILFALRAAKRQFPSKVAACGSSVGKVFVWLKPPSATGSNIRIFINSMSRLDEICTKEFGTSATTFIDNK